MVGGATLLFARLVLANLLADFLLQPSWLVRWKYERFGGLIFHSTVVLGLSLLGGWGYWSRMYLTLAVTLSIVHLCVDWLKIAVDRRLDRGYWPLATFSADQFLHVVSIALLLSMFGFTSVPSPIGAAGNWLMDSRHVLIVAIYVGAVAGGAVLVRIVVKSFGLPAADKPGLARAGALIGIIERFMLISLVAANHVDAAGFVLAAKSIARYKQLDNAEFAEYYLIGTLTSSAIAIIAGLAVGALLR